MLVSQIWDIHTFLMYLERNVYTTSWSPQLLISLLCKTKAIIVSLLCWGGVSFFAAAVLSHCGQSELHSLSLLPMISETSVMGVYWVSQSSENLGSWWFLPWSHLCVWLTLLPTCLGRGGKQHHVHMSSLEIMLFLLKHTCITLKISSVGNSGMHFLILETNKLLSLQANTQTLGATVWYFKH